MLLPLFSGKQIFPPVLLEFLIFFADTKLGSSSYVFNYFVYVSIGVVFATLAGMFVTVLAPYAAGSGIPEVSEIMAYVTGSVCTILLMTLLFI